MAEGQVARPGAGTTARQRPRRRPFRSVRAKAAAGAALVVGAFLVVGSVVFVALLTASLRGGIEESASSEAELVAAQVEAAGIPVLPASDDHLLALVDSGGTVVARSDDDVAFPKPVPTGATFTTTVDGDHVIYVRERVEIAGETYFVYAGRSLEDVDDAVTAVTVLLVVAVVVLVVLVWATAWVVVERSLAPVERIRREVADVQASDLGSRIEIPPSGDEVSRLAETMNEMLARLDRSQAVQRRFVSDASHELRSPLAAMRQYAEVAAAHPDRVEVGELASTVLVEGARVQDLVDSLLLLARLDERSQDGVRRPVDVDDLLLAEASRVRGVGTVHVDASGISAARTRGDEALLARVVRNLVDNAVRHASATVTLASTEDGGTVRVVVEDDGAGIAPDDRARVFDRFVRLDEARARDDGGSGLGLAIVADAVRVHGGSVDVTEGSAGGARFTVLLPRSDGV